MFEKPVPLWVVVGAAVGSLLAGCTKTVVIESAPTSNPVPAQTLASAPPSIVPVDKYEELMWKTFSGWPKSEAAKTCELARDTARESEWHERGDYIGAAIESKNQQMTVDPATGQAVNSAFPYKLYWYNVGNALRHWCTSVGK